MENLIFGLILTDFSGKLLKSRKGFLCLIYFKQTR